MVGFQSTRIFFGSLNPNLMYSTTWWLNWFGNHLHFQLPWRCIREGCIRVFLEHSFWLVGRIQCTELCRLSINTCSDTQRHSHSQGQVHWHKTTHSVIPSLTSRCAGQHNNQRYWPPTAETHTRGVKRCVGRSRGDCFHLLSSGNPFHSVRKLALLAAGKEKNSHPRPSFPFWPCPLSSCSAQAKPLTHPHTFMHTWPSKGYLPTVENEFSWISILISF